MKIVLKQVILASKTRMLLIIIYEIRDKRAARAINQRLILRKAEKATRLEINVIEKREPIIIC